MNQTPMTPPGCISCEDSDNGLYVEPTKAFDHNAGLLTEKHELVKSPCDHEDYKQLVRDTLAELTATKTQLNVANDVLSAEIAAHERTAMLHENTQTREKILCEKLDAEVKQREAVGNMLLSFLSGNPMLQQLIDDGVSNYCEGPSFERQVAAIIKDSFEDRDFERTVENIVEESVKNLNFEITVR